MLSLHRILLVILVCLMTSNLMLLAQTPESLPLCPSEEILCVIDKTWTFAELEHNVTEIEPGTGIVFAEADHLIFAYRTPSDDYSRVTAMLIALGYEAPMQPVEDNSSWWTLTFQFDGANDAYFSFGIHEQRSGSQTYKFEGGSWRGANTPQLPPFNEPLAGTYEVIPFSSEALDQTRSVQLYLPPNHDPQQTYPVIYVLDGETLPMFTGGIDHLITSGQIPALMMVGVPSGEMERRGEEYVPGRNPARYEAYENFLNNELRTWAQESYGASLERDDQILFGVSNGGLFTAMMTLRHPEIYGTVFVFSAGAGRGFVELDLNAVTVQLPLRVYSTAGTLETVFHQTTSEFADFYSDAGADVVFVEHLAGHDYAMWTAEFFQAVEWAFEE